MDSALLIHRLHFAFTVTYHYLFPQLTMGLAPLIVALKTLALWKNDERYNQRRALLGEDLRHQLRARRGDRHPHGIPVRHQLGAVLAVRRRRHRPDAGHGRHVRLLPGVRVPRPVPLRREAAEPMAALVQRRSWSLPARGCRATSSSPPTPGCSTRSAMSRMPTAACSSSSFWALVLNPWARWQYAHNMSGAVITGSFVMAAVGAFYLLSRKHAEQGSIFVRIGVIAGTASSSLLQLFPTGDGQGRNGRAPSAGDAGRNGSAVHIAAGAPLVIIGQPDVEQQKHRQPAARAQDAELPHLPALERRGEGPGRISQQDQWPDNIPLLYYSYHIMVGLGTIFIAVMMLSAVAAVAQEAVRRALDAVDPDAQLPASPTSPTPPAG